MSILVHFYPSVNRGYYYCNHFIDEETEIQKR